MFPRLSVALLFCFLTSVQAARPPAPPVEIVLRHALRGEAAALLVELVDRFNAQSRGERVLLQHLDMVTDPRLLPHMALLEDDEHTKFFASHPRMLPLWKALSLSREQIDARQLYPVLADVVEDNRGRLQALPLALSVPVLYYNKETFRRAGLDPERPPRTWWEVQEAAGRIFDVDRRCPFTTSNMAWVHLDNTSTQHREPIAGAARGGKVPELALNSLVQVKHVALLASWHKSFYFRYFGPGREADEKFLSGECAMLTGDSALHLQLVRRKPFDFGIASLPHYDDVRDAAPGRLLPDGALLWILADRKRQEYAAAVHFIQFLLRPEIQREWVRGTGFLPMTPAAATALTAGGAPPEALRRAVERLSDRGFASGAKPKAVAGLGRVRAILTEELEAVWANLKPAKEALDTAVRRGNTVLQPMPADGTVVR